MEVTGRVPCAKPSVKRVYETFGAGRIIWGELRANMMEFDRALQLFDSMFDFVPEPARAKIRGLNSQNCSVSPNSQCFLSGISTKERSCPLVCIAL
jgi:hypothetical protein